MEDAIVAQIIDGTTENDYLLGTKQLANRIDGTDKNDYLVGTQQNDQIFGYAGNDTLIGNAGNDILVGGLDDDLLTGGPGRDTFVLYFSGGGIDTITDFTLGEDYLEVKTAPNTSTNFPRSIIDPLTLESINSEAVDDFLRYDANTGAIDGIDTITNFTVGVDDRDGYKSDDTGDYIIGEQKKLAPNNNFPNEPLPSIIIAPTPFDLGNSFRYDTNTGALFYLGQQIAWIPLNPRLGQIEPTTTIDVYPDVLPAPIFNDM